MSIKWKKPSGLTIETNDRKETIEKCESLGWERIGGNAPKDEPEDLTRGPDTQMAKDKGKSKGSGSPESAE